MELGLQGKNVVVTGGSKGIGLACARGFLEEGARVVLVSRSRENLEAARRSLAAEDSRLLIVRADLVQVSGARDMLRRSEEGFGPIDVLLNCAGAAKRTLPEELTADAWHAAMDAKYFPYIHAMDAALPGMAGRGRGAVINVIGMGGKIATSIHLPGGAANAALMLATVGLAKVYAPKGVRVVAINPGSTMTERVREVLRLEAKARGASEEEVLAQGQAAVPLGRYAAPEDIAQAALFLASDKASYVTGAILSMDGGSSAVI